ncbi:MAG: hypothetical protein NC408_02080 [Candidatus Gastranaerophilales bacterium]|nr:hypothetical protein [Candidatus Gastranaerophilales bacterium]MCM1073315.1 hypothetical protein [Bacteroides sp.]
MLDKVSLNQKIQNFIAANPSVQGMNQTQLISCLIENGIVTLTELQELSIFASDQDYEAVGLTLQNTKTINDVIQQGKDSDILFKSNDGKTYNLNKTIQNKINKLNKDLEKAEDSNGWIGKAWSWTKNVTGIGDSSNKVRDKQAHEQELLKQFTMDNPKKAEIFKELTGVDFTPEALEAFIKGELPLESEKALEGYKEGQEMATDITADIISGISAFCIYTAAVAAAPFTGGASIAVGIAAAAASGAVIKSGIKALDCVGNNKEYTFKDLSYDLGTGAVSGLLAPVSAGAGGAIGKTVATKCGMQVLKSASKGVTEEVVTTGFKQTLQHSMLNPGSYKYVGGNLLQKTGVYGAEIAIDAGGSGALDGAFRADINGDDVIDGAVTGFGAGVFMGGAFKSIGGGWRKIKKAGKEEQNIKVHENDQINHITQADEGVPVVTSKQSLQERISNANTREEIKALQDEIKQMPSGIEKDKFWMQCIQKQNELNPKIKMCSDQDVCPIDNITSKVFGLNKKLAKNIIYKLQNKIEIGETLELRDYSITKIDESNCIIKHKYKPATYVQPVLTSTDDMLNSIEQTTPNLYKLISELHLAGILDNSHIENIYQATRFLYDQSMLEEIVIAKNGINNYKKKTTYQLYNSILRKENIEIPDGIDKDTYIGSLKKQIKLLSDFIDTFNYSQPMKLYRRDSFSILQSIKIDDNESHFNGKSLGEILELLSKDKPENIEQILHDIIQILNKKEPITNLGFTSTSIAEIGANACKRNTKPILWEYNTTGNIHGCYIDVFSNDWADELEFLLQANSKFRITSIEPIKASDSNTLQFRIHATLTQ